MKENLFILLLTFSLVFILSLINYVLKVVRHKTNKLLGMDYLKSRFKIKNTSDNKIGFILILINSFIIAFAGMVCTSFDVEPLWQLSIGFVILTLSIYDFYTILGKILERKERRKQK